MGSNTFWRENAKSGTLVVMQSIGVIKGVGKLNKNRRKATADCAIPIKM